ncbi:MAG: metallophosphoesterase family protein [Bacteroidetes bacterium]|nr:metallophosphoesterase family protein [Bacteroidota bacterium]
MKKMIQLHLIALICLQSSAQPIDVANLPEPVLIRGPYLQMGNQTAVTLRWRTNIATNTIFEVGTVYGNYPMKAENSKLVTEHEIRITGLRADTKYFYRFGSNKKILQADRDNFFTTAPPAGTKRKIRIAAFGDCGRNSNSYQSGALSSYINYVGNNPAEVLLLLGDNAYNRGTDSEYQANYFNIYSPTILKHHQLFPAPGNHDYANTTERQKDHKIPYYSIFSTPSMAQCGGVASGTKAYYSWDWGNIHFLSLDSYGEENNGTTRLYDTLGAQVKWIKRDLAANKKNWVIAYWHHPPYTMGSHNSDEEEDLVSIRQNFIRILERMGVDLIICGHSHNYERSFLLNGHYGNETTFDTIAHTKSTSSAKYDGSENSCPYLTNSGRNHGTVYVVAGSSGASGSVNTGYPHNAMPFSVNDGGMFYLEVEDNRLDAKFIRRTGDVWDKFTIIKNVTKTKTVTIKPGASVSLTASWPGNYNWSNGGTGKTILVKPASNAEYIVQDTENCVVETFKIKILNAKAKK